MASSPLLFSVVGVALRGVHACVLGAITEARYATTKAQAVACWQVVLGPSFRG